MHVKRKNIWRDYDLKKNNNNICFESLSMECCSIEIVIVDLNMKI